MIVPLFFFGGLENWAKFLGCDSSCSPGQVDRSAGGACSRGARTFVHSVFFFAEWKIYLKTRGEKKPNWL